MKPILTLLLICFSIAVMAQKTSINKKIDSVAAKSVTVNIDSLETISIQDLNVLLQALENQPTFTKHDFDKVKQSLEFLIQISQQRRTKPKK